MGEIGNRTEFMLNLTGQKIHFKNIDNIYSLVLYEKIGAGTYGDVYKAKLQNSNSSKSYAVKHYREDTKSILQEGVTCTTLRELSALQNSVHVNLVKIEDLFIGKNRSLTNFINTSYAKWLSKGNGYLDGYPLPEHQVYVFAAYEYCPGGDVKKLLQDKKHKNPSNPERWGLPLRDTKQLTFQLLNGLSYLHNNKMCHRDLKPDNLMLDRVGSMGILKIGDLGLCRELRSYSGELTPTVCTIYYRPLEVILGRMRFADDSDTQYEIGDKNGLGPHYGLGVDIWSAGCIMAEMISGKPLFKGTQEFEVLTRITKILGTPTEAEWKNCSKLQYYPYKNPSKSHFFPCFDKIQHLNCILEGRLDALGLDLLSRMFHYNPHLRITAAEALSHSWFSDLNFDYLDGIGIYNWCWKIVQYIVEKTNHLNIDQSEINSLKSSKISHLLLKPDFNHPLSSSIHACVNNLNKKVNSTELNKTSVLPSTSDSLDKCENSKSEFQIPNTTSKQLSKEECYFNQDNKSTQNDDINRQGNLKPNVYPSIKDTNENNSDNLNSNNFPSSGSKISNEAYLIIPTGDNFPITEVPTEKSTSMPITNNLTKPQGSNEPSLEYCPQDNKEEMNPSFQPLNSISISTAHSEHSGNSSSLRNKSFSVDSNSNLQLNRTVRSTTRAQTILSYAMKGKKYDKKKIIP